MTDRKRKPFKVIEPFFQSFIHFFLKFLVMFIYLFFRGRAWHGAGESMGRSVKSMLLKVGGQLVGVQSLLPACGFQDPT